MRAQISSAAENEAKVALTRNKLVLDQARAVGLLGTAKNTRLSGRVPSELIEAAKKRAHVTSDTELLELALARLALEMTLAPASSAGKAAFQRTSTLGFDLLETLRSLKPQKRLGTLERRADDDLPWVEDEPTIGGPGSWTPSSIWMCSRGDRRQR